VKKLVLVVSLALIAPIALAGPASAHHSWSDYHWARQSNPFTLKLGDNVSGSWDSMLVKASTDWTKSTVLDTSIVAGGTRPKSCRPTSGRVEVCSANYSNTGWLGLAQIWISGKHITQGIVKNNDYYFSSSTNYQYDNTAEMQHVICQEIGHTFGLDHQSTSGASFGTCMDYYHNTTSSDTKSTSPNQGDYDELLCIYDPASFGKTLTSGSGSTSHSCTGTGHLDSTTTVGAAFASHPDAVPSFSPAWQISESRYIDQLPNGDLLVTWVTWAR
jgi:hypothetical protein